MCECTCECVTEIQEEKEKEKEREHHRKEAWHKEQTRQSPARQIEFKVLPSPAASSASKLVSVTPSFSAAFFLHLPFRLRKGSGR